MAESVDAPDLKSVDL